MALPAFVEDVPDYEVRHGQIYISLGGLELVMSIKVFMDGVARAEAAIAKWHLRELSERENNVVQLRH